MNNSHLVYSARKAFVATMLISSLIISTFFAFEPSVGQAITSNNFTVTQTVTSEIAFLVQPSNVTMTGTISGLTGGHATGTTVVSVNTNNSIGYNMTLGFSSTTAMKLSGANSVIANYTQTGAAPDFNWADNTTGQSAEFGYSVSATTPGEIDSSFKNDTTNCGAGTNETAGKCWATPKAIGTPETIINAPAANGSSTTTLTFKVAVPNAPSPALPSGNYIATGTLTAVVN